MKRVLIILLCVSIQVMVMLSDLLILLCIGVVWKYRTPGNLGGPLLLTGMGLYAWWDNGGPFMAWVPKNAKAWWVAMVPPKNTTKPFIWQFWRKTFWTRCECCGCRGASKRRQCTAYHDDSMNWKTLCPVCQDEADEYWQERWDEYHSSVL